MKYRLRDIALHITDGTHSTVVDDPTGSYFLLSCKNIKDGEILFDADDRKIDKGTFDKLRKRTKLDKDDILITTVGTIGEMAMIRSDDICFELQRSVGIIKPNKKIVYPPYLYYLLMSMKKYIQSLVKGAVQQCLFLGDIKEIVVDIPSLEEQKEKCLLFEEIDRKKRINKDLLQLLEQEVTLEFLNTFLNKDLNKDWGSKKLKEVTDNVRKRVGTNNYRVLSAVNSGKLMPSDEYFTKQVFSKNIDKYLVVEQNNFAYNPARINIGSIGLNEYDFIGCVSPVYVVFKVEDEYHYFFKYFIRSNKFKLEAKLRSSGSVRQTLNYDDFGLIEIKYPPKNEVLSFNSFYKPILEKQNKLLEENSLLTSLLNNLLKTEFAKER